MEKKHKKHLPNNYAIENPNRQSIAVRNSWGKEVIVSFTVPNREAPVFIWVKHSPNQDSAPPFPPSPVPSCLHATRMAHLLLVVRVEGEVCVLVSSLKRCVMGNVVHNGLGVWTGAIK